MCLDRLCKTPPRKIRTGFKVLLKPKIVPESSFAIYQSPIMERYMGLKSVLHADNNKRIRLWGINGFYTTGFHVFISRRAAEKYYDMIRAAFITKCPVVMVKVKYRDVTASGYEGKYRVDIAQSMELIEEIPIDKL